MQPNAPGLTAWTDFLAAMTEREIKARYKTAWLGFLWIFLNPLFQMMVIGVIFQFFVPAQVDNYFLFLFTGLLPWNYFSYSLTKTVNSIVYERSLIQKAKFPREAIVLSIVLSNLFHLGISLVLLIMLVVGIALWQGEFTIGWLLGMVTAVVGAVTWLTLLTAGLSLLVSALNVRYRDMNFVVQALMPLWFYATPVIYSLKLLPEYLHIIAYLNPVTPVIEWMQWAIVGQQPLDVTWWWVGAIVTLVCLVVGIITFRAESPTFDDWL